MCSDLFIYDETDDEPENPHIPPRIENIGKGQRAVITGQTDASKLVAGLDVSVADQLQTLIEHLAQVLMDSCNITKEEAHKKIRWASHVTQGRR